LDALAGKVVTWSGVVWRLVLRGTDPLTANSRGARWNSSEFEAVYFSLDPRAANAELDYLLARQPVPIVAERQLYRFDITLTKVLDIRAGHGLEEFGLDADALTGEDWTHPQAIGLAAYKYLECSAVLVPSARFPSANLVLFLGGMGEGDDLSEPEKAPTTPTEI
jgi:RES domain-containing protein